MQGCEATNLQCSLSRRRMVFVATRRRPKPGLEGKMIGAAAAACKAAGKGSPTGGAPSIAGPEFASPWRAKDRTSIVASLPQKPVSTASASASISVFLAARFLWTQSAASSADRSSPMPASNSSRNAADGSGPRTVLAGRTPFSLRPEPDVAGAPMDALDRCMAALSVLSEKTEADRARLRSLCPNATARRFLRVIRHQGFEFGLRSHMVEKG